MAVLHRVVHEDAKPIREINEDIPVWLCHIVEKLMERGLKVVAIDPRLRGAGPFADEWVPIRPGTDTAMMSAMAYVMLTEKL